MKVPTRFENSDANLPAISGALALCALGAALVLAGCVHPAKPQAPQPTTVAGRVVQADAVNRGVPGVTVRAVGKTAVTSSDSTGQFSLMLDVIDGEVVQLSLTKAGYNEFVTSLSVGAGRANSLPIAITLASASPGGGSGGTGGGAANSVVLMSSSAASIGVLHSGSNESATLVFEVRDAQGNPVNFAHRATVQFAMSQMVGGGASLSPDTVSTDANGRVAVTLNAGTLAQAVQVRAQVTGSAIYSEPAVVAIHGGPPNSAHFSFAPATINVPGLLQYGIVDAITAFVGDTYGNPVPAGTVVYFTTTGGIVQGSAVTDDHGRASVDLVTAAPLPNDPPALSDSAGIARISIQTVGDTQAPIVHSALAVVFSGHTELGVSPQTFDIALDGSQDFTVTVRDREHHNPLTKGTTVTFAASAGTIAGETSYVLPDTRDAQFTSFTFRIENPTVGPVIVGPNRTRIPFGIAAARRQGAGYSTIAATGGASPASVAVTTPVRVSVRVTSANGNASAFVSGAVERP